MLRKVDLTKGKAKKLAMRWKGPSRVIEQRGDLNYVIRGMDNVKDTQLVHVERLKPYFEADPRDTFEVEVEEVKGKRTINNRTEYLVKWKGWTESHNEWLNESKLENAKEAILRYEREANGPSSGAPTTTRAPVAPFSGDTTRQQPAPAPTTTNAKPVPDPQSSSDPTTVKPVKMNKWLPRSCEKVAHRQSGCSEAEHRNKEVGTAGSVDVHTQYDHEDVIPSKRGGYVTT